MESSADPFLVPEHAISTFEKLAKVRVTIHDLEGSLWPFLSPDRFQHRAAQCTAVQAGGFLKDCMRFDISVVQREMPRCPEGRVQVCHAGLLECVVPVFGEGELRWVLFAGVRDPGTNHSYARRDPVSTRARDVWSQAWPAAPVEATEVALVLEGLRQLAARLRCWLIDSNAAIDVDAGPSALTDRVSRWRLIQTYIARRYAQHARLDELAKLLGVSETRAGHIVCDLCGKSFVRLLTEARLRTAAMLLRASDLPIPQIAARSGWFDLSRFYRVFRREMGVTPQTYRRTPDDQSRTVVRLRTPVDGDAQP